MPARDHRAPSPRPARRPRPRCRRRSGPRDRRSLVRRRARAVRRAPRCPRSRRSTTAPVRADLHVGHQRHAEGSGVHARPARTRRGHDDEDPRPQRRRRHLLRDAVVPLERDVHGVGTDARGRARRSRCAASSRRRSSCPTSARSAPPTSTTSASRWRTCSRRPSNPTTPTTRSGAGSATKASDADLSRFAERFGCPLIDGYGQSETGASINRLPGMPAGALGKPLSDTVRIIDPATMQECPPRALRRRRPVAERGRGHR